MAAYASLVSLTHIIDELLRDHDQDPTSHEKQPIKCIYEHLIFLQAIVDNYPERLDSKLEATIRDLAYRAEDLIGYFMTEEILSSLRLAQVNQTEHHELRYDIRSLNPTLEKITEEIESLVGEVIEIQNSARTTQELQLRSTEDENIINSLGAADSSSKQLAPTNKDAMVGFDDDLIAIKARLCGVSSKLQVIPIYGMGGIGKTTLAKNVYDDQLTVEHFHIRAWVTVSQEYEVEGMLSELLLSIKGERSKHGSKSQTVESLLYKSLKGRRYLIVMDDIWSTDAWDNVRRIFPDDDDGSRIMLTTRLYDVATYPDSSIPLHEMGFMDADQSWNLLKQKLFQQGDICPPELENVGKYIARGCKGLPLAIVVVAGLLSKTKALWEWKKIERNVNLAISSSNEDQFENIFSLSYNHLPHYLRACLLFMGSFREDYKINVSKLTKLWVAMGFLKPSVSKSIEEVAEECLEDLVKRSLVIVIQSESNGRIKTCSLHDSVRDMCIRKAHEDKFLLDITDRFIDNVLPQNNLTTWAPIRAICFLRGQISPNLYLCCRLLRILDTLDAYDGGRMFPLPTSMYELFHLRYLAFNYPPKIPAAISNLQYLQTLIVHPRKKYLFGNYVLAFLVTVPPEIWRLPNLRHLVSFCLDLLPDPKGATSALQNLHTLSEATNFICNQEIWRMIPNLKKLGLYYFGDKYVEDYHLDNLVFLHQLEKLTFKVHSTFPFRQKLNPVFPTSLKRLTLSGWRLPKWKEMGRILGLLPDLEVLKLRCYACTDRKWETTEGEFPKLKFLLIEASYLKKWITESSHFPCLMRLVLKDCWQLREIPDSIAEIPTLELIEVDNWNKSLVKSAKRIQKEQQENWGNDDLRVRLLHYTKRTDDVEFRHVGYNYFKDS